jgi:hypothetical protein
MDQQDNRKTPGKISVELTKAALLIIGLFQGVYPDVQGQSRLHGGLTKATTTKLP